ncbi:MAG: YggS family pyridoxal phosphate-dependent enzyme [Prevotella sp.]|nr:YggS family pyridoxal phosphate-dependent enzyme [Prevotella sp.]MBQ9561187.1 YggS family pyridoxal phosphate-dependent enzyme [Prevotella sp.]MBR1839132.1 YggS family pyridoxal phosphate-dependent enzyme [Prevotella sp.]
MSIKSNLQQVRSSLRNNVELVAVSKYHTIEAVQEAYDAGQRVFGESREQELRIKHDTLPKDIMWHFIGHMQTNKVKYIAPYIAMIEAVDSFKLIKEIEKQAAKNNRTIDILLELHLAQEESKSGMLPDECLAMLEEGEWRNMPHVRIRGIMMMASNTDDEQLIKSEFLRAKELFDVIKQRYFADDEAFSIRSYGMSGDYLLAQECGSNHVRVGSRIFSE